MEDVSVVDENMHGSNPQQSGLDLVVEMYASDDEKPTNMQLEDETESDEEYVACGSTGKGRVDDSAAGHADHADGGQRRTSKLGRPCVRVDENRMRTMFGMPQPEAAKALGVSLSTLKMACRRLGLSRWPYRRCGRPSKGNPRGSADTSNVPDHFSHDEHAQDKFDNDEIDQDTFDKDENDQDKFEMDENDQDKETRMMQLQDIKNALDSERPKPKIFNAYLTTVNSKLNRLPTNRKGIELLRKIDSGLFWSLWKLMHEKQGKTGLDLKDKVLGHFLTRHIHNIKTAKTSGIRECTNGIRLQDLFGRFVEWKGDDFTGNQLAPTSDVQRFMKTETFSRFQSQYNIPISFKQVQAALYKGNQAALHKWKKTRKST